MRLGPLFLLPLLAALASFLASSVHAQSAPDRFSQRPVRFIIAFPPGALNDMMGRVLAPRLAESWGQQVVVDNRPGSGTIIGTEFGAFVKLEASRWDKIVRQAGIRPE